jgi:hypothetical protein
MNMILSLMITQLLFHTTIQYGHVKHINLCNIYSHKCMIKYVPARNTLYFLLSKIMTSMIFELRQKNHFYFHTFKSCSTWSPNYNHNSPRYPQLSGVCEQESVVYNKNKFIRLCICTTYLPRAFTRFAFRIALHSMYIGL